MNFITAGSYSRLNVFSTCKFRAKLAFVDKIPEPDRGTGPLTAPDGTAEWHNDRGSRIHDLAENYVTGLIDRLDPSLKKFQHEFEALRKMHTEGNAITEQMWCFDSNWKTIPANDYANTWMRIKTDATVFTDKTTAIIIDYKTGKRYGNEVSHASQCQLYQLGAFLKYPKLEKVETELWYLDQNEMHSMSFTREQGMKLFNLWNNKNIAMTTCVDFAPSPNAYNCKWCPYGPKKSGDCTVGIQN